MKFMAGIKAAINRILPRAEFARSVGVLVGGTAGAQALLILASPLLTRLYTPDDFGLLAAYAGVLAIFSVIATFRYELAIPLPDRDDDAANLVALCLLMAGIVSILAVLVVIFARDIIPSLLGVESVGAYLWLLPVGVLLVGFGNTLRYFAIRKKAFGVVAKASVKASVINVTIQLLGFKLGAISLILGQAGSQGAGTISMGRFFFNGKNTKLVRWSGIKYQAVRYKKFPIFSTWEGLLNTAGTQLPPVLFAVLFGPAAAGLYSLASRVLSMPMSLIGGAVGQVFLSEATDAHRTGRLGKLVTDLHSKLAHIGLPAAVLIFVAGPEIFSIIFGAGWKSAGEFARWMIPWLYLVFVSSPLSTLFSIMEKQKQGMAFQVILLMARIVAIYIGAQTGDLLMAVMLFSATSAVCWFGFLIWIAIATGSRLVLMIRPTLIAGAIAVTCVLPLVLALIFGANFSNAWSIGFGLSAMLVVLRSLYLVRRSY